MNRNLEKKLLNLRPNKKGKITSPHKIALLLAVAQLFEEGLIYDNRIDFSPELVAYFQKIGLLLSPEYGNKLLIHMPFYHLQSSGFWHLKTISGFERMLTSSNSPKSLKAMSEYIEYAQLSPELYHAMLNPIEREVLRTILINKYFPDSSLSYTQIEASTKLYLELEENIFLNGAVTDTETEMEYEVRGSLFKQRVPKIYNYRCAISGLQVSSTLSISMVDACHIQPWSLNHIDTIQNGICLTPTLHRAFDRGLIAISDDYRVIISESFMEDKNSSYAISQFNRKPLLLPHKKEYAPSLDFIAWHRENSFQV
ncbi:MAG: HNH endonuclease [Bacteroidia bacterium]